MPSNVLFRLFLLLTTQVGSISAVIRLIFENCYNYTLLNAKINVLWAIVICNSCTLLRNVKKVFCKNAQPASAQCRSRVWVFPTSILQSKMVFVYTKTLLADADVVYTSALLATIVLVLKGSQPVSCTDAQT